MIVSCDSNALTAMTKVDQAILRAKFADPLFQQFLRVQWEAAQKRQVELDPEGVTDPVKFLQTAKELRLVSQFWSDLLSFVEGWAMNEGAPANATMEI